MTNLLLHVDSKTFPEMCLTNSKYQVANLGRGSVFHQDLEDLPVDWERGKIVDCKLTQHLESLENQSCNSFFPATHVFVK